MATKVNVAGLKLYLVRLPSAAAMWSENELLSRCAAEKRSRDEYVVLWWNIGTDFPGRYSDKAKVLDAIAGNPIDWFLNPRK